MQQSNVRASKKLGFRKAFVIDDAYAGVEPSDIEGEDISKFAGTLQDDEAKLLQVRTFLDLPDLDPNIAAHIEAAVQDPSRLTKLWENRAEKKWAWLREALFSSYATQIDDRLDELTGLETVLKRLKWDVTRLSRFEPNQIDFTSCQAIFLDFFLKGETLTDDSLARAKSLGEYIIKARQDGHLTKYPLVFLMSSREGASAEQNTFKSKTGLRADFFKFLAKSEFENIFDKHFQCMLGHYEERQQLAQLLDEYWLAAVRAANSLRQDLAMLEPTELALLHEAELGVEQAVLPDYLSWLVSEYVGAKVIGDEKVRRVASELPSLYSHSAFPGAVPPTSRLAEMHVRSVMRLDVSDDIPDTKAKRVSLGDLFARFPATGGNPDRLLLVIDQSCDLIRPTTKETILCLRCKPLKLDDVALAFYRSSGDGDKIADIVPIEVNGRIEYFLAKWELENPETPQLKDLARRLKRYKRIARYKTVSALARQAMLTHKVGRIGEPAVPPNAIAYRVRVFLNGKEPTFRRDLDSMKEPWAGAVIVQGRHLPFTGAPVDANTAGKATATGKPESKASSRLSLTSDFLAWLKEKLEAAHLSDTQAAQSGKTLIAKINDGSLQRMELKSDSKVSLPSVGVLKVTKPTKITVAFGKSLPEEAKTDQIVLLLRPYSTPIEEGEASTS